MFHIKRSQVKKGEICNVTSMKLKKSYWLEQEDYPAFLKWYTKELKKGTEWDLSVMLRHTPYTTEMGTSICKVFLDLDDVEKKVAKYAVDCTIEWLETYVCEKAKSVTKINSVKNNKFHIFFNDGLKRRIAIAQPFLKELWRDVEEKVQKKYPSDEKIVDSVTALRMPGAIKKEGKEAGYYPLKNITLKNVMKDCPIYLPKTDFHYKVDDEIVHKINKREEDKMENMREKAEKQKLKSHQTLNEFEIEERIEFILPVIIGAGLCDKRGGWWSTTKACAEHGYPLDKLCNYLSILDNSDEKETNDAYMRYINNPPFNPSQKTTIGTLLFMLEKANKEKYEEYKSLYFRPDEGGDYVPKEIFENIYKDDKGFAKIIEFMMSDDIAITDIKKGEGYFWNQETKLWEETSLEHLRPNLMDCLEKSCEAYLRYLEKKQVEEQEIKAFKTKILRKSRTAKCCNSAFSVAKSLLFRKGFIERLNYSVKTLAIPGGRVLHLDTLEIRDRTKEDYFSYETNVGVGDANNEKVVKFFSDIHPDENVREYFRQLVGYSFSGSTRERILPIIHGPRANGKSVFLNMLDRILGNYSDTAPRDAITKSRNNNRHQGAATPHLIPFVGKRFMSCSETEEGDRLNDAFLKSMTGNDPISARANYGEQFTFLPTAKIFLVTNFRPSFDAEDAAMVERIRYIPFDTVFVENPSKDNERIRDTNFVEDLMENHLPDVFAYFLQGSKQYWKQGKLFVPETLETAKKDYVEDQDLVAEFINETLQARSNSQVLSSTLYREYYSDWCREMGEDRFTMRRFMAKLRKMGYNTKKSGSRVYLLNVEIIQSDEEKDAFDEDNKIIE